VAINTGDYLLGKGYELLGELPFLPEKLTACYQLVSSGHVALSLGQGADLLASKHHHILSVDQQLEIFERKTGSAIRVALLLGAVAAGASKSDIEVLKAFSGYFGMAYQIKDDLDEFIEAHEETGLADYPLLLSLLAANLDKEDRLALQLGYIEHDRKGIEEQIKQSGTNKQAENLLHEYTSKAYQELDKLTNLRMKLSLYNVLGKIF